ncbi:MAG: ArsR/SmtB family transcription factor [Halosimplex sp.]
MEPTEVLGSKARLEIVRALSRRDMYVSELMEEVGMDGKTATHHLDVLTDAEIVSTRMEGRRRYYSLEREITLSVSPPPERRFVLQFRSPE